MAQRNIDFGTFPDDPDADAIRTAFQKVQENFTELFGGLQDQAVISVNRTSGAGITVNSPTGNVVVTANIACVQVHTSTLSIGRDANGSQDTSITSSSQTLWVDLPANIANVANINLTGNLYANTITSNLQLNGNIGSFSGNLTASNLIANSRLTVTGNANVGNLGATTGIFTANVDAVNFNGTNVVATGNVSGSRGIFAGNISAGNANLGNLVTANFFSGDGSNLSNVISVAGNLIKSGGSQVFVVLNGNVTSTVNGYDTLVVTTSGVNVAGTGNFTGNLTAVDASLGNSVTANYFVGNLYGAANTATSATTAGTVTTNAQPNITSVGTLSALTVTGNAGAGNVNAVGGVFTYVSGDGGNLSNITGANITGAVAFATTANAVAGANVSGAVSYATTANAVAGANVSGAVAYATTANSVAGANVSGQVGNALVAGTVYTNAQPNITSVGTLTSLDVTGNVTAGNVYANSGTIGASLLTGTLTTNAQPNITSVGSLSSLTVTGNIGAGNINGGNLVSANFFSGDGSGLTNISVGAGSFITNGNSNVQVDANSDVRVSVSGNANILVVTGTGANITGTLNVTSNANVGNLGAIGVIATTVGGSLTTASQPNITSLGTLAGLNVAGTSNLGPNSNVIITGGTVNQFLISNGAGGVSWVTPANVTTAPGSNTQVIFNDNGSINATSGLTFNKNTNALNVLGNANVGNIGADAGIFTTVGGSLTTNAQPNITSIGALTSLTVSGNINAGNVQGGNLVTANYFAGTLTTNAQPNITSVGTLTGLNVNGTVTASAFTANTGIFTGNGSGLTNLAGANITGTVANATFATSAGSATTAGTVTTNAQPNITSVGALTSLTVSGNINAGNVSGGNLVSANFFSGNGSALASITGANVTGAVAFATTANSVAGANVSGAVSFASTANAVAGANVSGEVSFASTANAVAGANVSGTVANAAFATTAGSATSATTAGTVTTAAQPNITSVGTLSSVSVTGNASANNFVATSYHIRSVGTAISAAGSTQGTATAISKEINIVSTVASGAGVILPAVAGAVITITNTSANSLLVYPASGAAINSLAANAGFTQGAGSTLQFIAPTATQYYTVGATYA
jgi:hypothetical protein